MKINDLTIGEAKELANIFGGNSIGNNSPLIGKKVIVRTYSAGNWFGVLDTKDGDEVYIKNARRMWYWKAKESISLSACAIYGVSSESKICAPVDLVWLQAVEIMPCTEESISSLEDAPNVEAR